MNFIYLICLLLLPNRPLPKFKRPIYLIRPNATVGTIDTPVGQALVRNNLDDISLWALLTRQVLFLDILRSDVARNRKELIMVRMSRFLCLDVRFCLSLAGLHQMCFGARKHGQKVIYTSLGIATSILTVHWPDYYFVEVKYDAKHLAQRLFYAFLKLNEYRLQKNEEAGLSIFINIQFAASIHAYLLVNPNRQVIIRYFDDLACHWKKGLPFFQKLTRSLQRRYRNIHVESYSKKDAQQLGGTYVPNAVNPERLKDSSQRRYLISFFGNSIQKSNRSVKLQELVLNLKKSQRINDQFIKLVVIKNKKDSLAFKALSYVDYLAEIADTEVVVDFYRLVPDEGYSYRISEALFLNKKIITDRPQILQESFYSPERIFCVGHDSWDRLPSFLQTDIKPLPAQMLKPFDTRYWNEKYNDYLKN